MEQNPEMQKFKKYKNKIQKYNDQQDINIKNESM